MIIEVEMLAFGQPGEIRRVFIPDEHANISDDAMLALVFYWGQNDFQPQKQPSVSVGDVVRLESGRYRCLPVGWQKLEEEVVGCRS